MRGICYTVAVGLGVLAFPFSARADGESRNGWKVVDSVIVGALAHDLGERDADGIDPNIELRLDLPITFTDELRILPTVGGTANFNGGASTLYLGGTLQYQHPSGVFVEGFLGLAGHNADTPTDRNEADLGCDLLFRESAEAGYAWGQHRVSAVIAHYSHGRILCSSDANDGLTQTGLRYGYRFE